MEEKVMENNEKLAARIFDSVVKTYDAFLNFATFGFINSWQNEMINNVPSGRYFVDIGTGTGEVVKKVNDIYPEANVIGIDVSLGMLKKAVEKNRNRENDLFIKASALEMPLKDETVDAVLSSLVFRHLPPEKAAKEISRVLKKGGYLGILDISKPKIKLIYKLIFFFANVIFRPIGTRIFSKKEYDYFMESIENLMTAQELESFLKNYSFTQVYQSSKVFGMVTISIFRKK